MKTGLPARTRDDFLVLWRRPLAFHLLMQLLGVAFFTPLIGGIANHLVALTGREIADAGLAWAGIDVHRVLPLIALFLTVSAVGGGVYGALQLAGHQFLVTRMYAEQTDAKWKVPPQLETSEESASRRARPARPFTCGR